MPKRTSSRKKTPTQVWVALIGSAGVIVAALLGSPVLRSILERTPIPSSTDAPSPTTIPIMSTPTHTATPTSTFTPSPTPCPFDSSKYGFESTEAAWKAQTTYTGYRAVTAVTQSEERAKFGCYSLKLNVELVSGDVEKSKGEAFVDLIQFPPTGVQAPINLESVLITVWMYVPGGAAGDPNKPNGIQVFVKDWNFRSYYGTWFNLPGFTDRWIRLSLKPSRQPSPNGFMDQGFDPSNIVIVGVKIGAGADSTATYGGPIYVDGVDW